MDNISSKKDTIILAKDSQEFIESINYNIINPYLSHNRFLEKTEKQNVSLLFNRLKKTSIKDECFCKKKLIDILQSINKRNKILADTFTKKESYLFCPSDKIIIGTGGTSPYGNIQSIKLHHLYGIPYIPASTIKGTLKNCWILKEFEGDEKKACEDKAFKRLFGAIEEENSAMQGELVFFDSFPQKFFLALDVQTVHYKDYYTEDNKLPTDNESPIPIFFTCLKEAKFEIRIACKEDKIWDENKNELDKAVNFMFSKYGIGAKTALGYGLE